MTLYEEIRNVYPELENKDFHFDGVIGLRDDSDGLGVYIVKWEYSKPIPAGLKLGK
jgi:hypothetical protein